MAPMYDSDHTEAPIRDRTAIIEISSSPEPSLEPDNGRAHYLRLSGKPSNLGSVSRVSGSASFRKPSQNQSRSKIVLDSGSQGSTLLGSSLSSTLDLNEHRQAMENSLTAKPTKKRKLERPISDQAMTYTTNKGFATPPNLFSRSTIMTRNHTPLAPMDHASRLLPETPRRFSKRLLQRSVSTTELGQKQLPMVPDRGRSLSILVSIVLFLSRARRFERFK
jgi:hypothetical protein